MKRLAIVLGIALTLTAAAKPAPGLDAYVGKYPSDKVAGISFLKHPIVRSAVSEAAPNLGAVRPFSPAVSKVQLSAKVRSSWQPCASRIIATAINGRSRYSRPGVRPRSATTMQT